MKTRKKARVDAAIEPRRIAEDMYKRTRPSHAC